jgi:hypothetical protein
MELRSPAPRGLVSRSVLAALIFAATAVPGWTLGGLVDRWTGSGPLDWFVTCGWSALTVVVLAPHASYRGGTRGRRWCRCGAGT